MGFVGFSGRSSGFSGRFSWVLPDPHRGPARPPIWVLPDPQRGFRSGWTSALVWHASSNLDFFIYFFSF
jgi:hypothetical protein